MAAMAYPPQKYHDFAATGGKDGPMVDERAPPSEADVAQEVMVHFDLDSSNSKKPSHLNMNRSSELTHQFTVLVGDRDTTDGHIGLTPLLKLHDFGISEFVQPHFNDK
jgi:hypothetical protein